MNRWITPLTIVLTVGITMALNRIYEPNVWVAVGIAVGVAALVATVLVTGHALLIRLSRHDGQS